MKTAQKVMSVEEYIQHELKSERRHEYINGQLFEMPGEKDINNEVAGALYAWLLVQLRPQGYFVYNHDVKVALPDSAKYYYPDVFATREQKTKTNQYIKSEPELIIEVVSESSHKADYVDKFIDYTKIPSLLYYLVVEPEAQLVTASLQEDGEWIQHKFTSREQIIDLPKLGIALPMADIYQSQG